MLKQGYAKRDKKEILLGTFWYQYIDLVVDESGGVYKSRIRFRTSNEYVHQVSPLKLPLPMSLSTLRNSVL